MAGIVLNQQNDNGSDQHKSKERSVELIIAGKKPTKSFEFLKETFNQMALFVGVPVHGPRIVDVALGWDGISSCLGDDVLADRFRGIRFVAKDVTALNLNLAEQWDRVFGVMVISSAKQKGHWIPHSIYYGMNFCISSAF